MTDGEHPKRSEVIRASADMLELSWPELWVIGYSMGSNLTATELQAFLAGRREITDVEYDVLAAGLNDAFVARDKGQPVPYSDELPD